MQWLHRDSWGHHGTTCSCCSGVKHLLLGSAAIPLHLPFWQLCGLLSTAPNSLSHIWCATCAGGQPWAGTQGCLRSWSSVVAFRLCPDQGWVPRTHSVCQAGPRGVCHCSTQGRVRADENFPGKHWKKAMNQNEKASWNILSPNNRGQFPIDSQAAGISQHHRQSRHINHLKAFGLTLQHQPQESCVYWSWRNFQIQGLCTLQGKNEKGAFGHNSKENTLSRNFFRILWTDRCQHFGNLKVWLLQRPSSWLSSPERLGLLWNTLRKTGIHRELELCFLKLVWSQLPVCPVGKQPQTVAVLGH